MKKGLLDVSNQFGIKIKLCLAIDIFLCIPTKKPIDISEGDICALIPYSLFRGNKETLDLIITRSDQEIFYETIFVQKISMCHQYTLELLPSL